MNRAATVAINLRPEEIVGTLLTRHVLERLTEGELAQIEAVIGAELKIRRLKNPN